MKLNIISHNMILLIQEKKSSQPIKPAIRVSGFEIEINS
jgi:hypothetical protein